MTDIKKYNRQIILPGFGLEAQFKLTTAKVLVVGCGGLGSPILLYLAASGIGHIGIIENDQVDISNLHRQILFDTTTIGNPKIIAAADKLKKINPDIYLELYNEKITNKNALQVCKNFDIIIDGSDNFPTRYLVNDTCEILKKTLIYGAIHQYEGQVGVFNHNSSSSYRDLFPEPPTPEMAPNCAEAGVIGSLAGIIGSLMATEAIKILTGLGKPLVNQLLLIDVLEMQFKKIKFSKIPSREPITELINYENFCGIDTQTDAFEITKNEYLEWVINKKEFLLIDVREPHEHELFNIGGANIPLAEVETNEQIINSNQPILFYCSTGQRSKIAMQKLNKKLKHSSFYSLNVDIREFD